MSGARSRPSRAPSRRLRQEMNVFLYYCCGSQALVCLLPSPFSLLWERFPVFPSAKQLAGYVGLGAGVHTNGETFATGRITKAGRKELRWAMVESATHTVQDHPHFKVEYERLCKTIGKKKAMVAVARKLLLVVW